jgi:hypothetical protein
MALTDKQCKENDSIPTTEIEQDIAVTRREIDQYSRELDALRGNIQGNKVGIYMAEGKISQRSEFIYNLKSIILYRIGRAV